ncbi:MAG TPA: CvpA family protein [Candidatus Limnocylindria bacterium]|nr:CvpA family protein [Candidatus Limnocylindria bacterium]
MEFISDLRPIDLFVVLCLAAGVFMGFTQGIIRTLLNCVVVLIAFVVASILRDPLFDLLTFWQAFTPELRREIVYLVLFIGVLIGGWFAVRSIWQRSRLPIPKSLDEIGGAILGVLFVALIITFLMVVLDAFFVTAPDAATASAGLIKSFYDALNASVLVDFFRTALLPTFGVILRPLVPSDIDDLLVAP